MNKIRHIQIQGHGRAILLCLMLFLCINVGAQSNGGIVIGGDVYGGGHNGAVGTDNASTPAPAKNKVKMKADSVATIAASVTVYDGTIRSIFGGGENGRTYGSTSVTVEGANTVIGRTALVGTVNGGLFGAGDGDSAYVFGHSNVLIKGGTINQNVYGGGNKADLMGATHVTLQGGTLNQAVYGGSRLANIFGYSLVDIDGAHATQDLVIKAVYGGNDIAGHIEASNTWDWTLWTKMQIPSGIFAHTGSYGITTIEGGVPVTQYNSLVHASPEANGNNIFVGQVFGGGNGDYGNYPPKPGTDSLTVGALGTTFTVFSKPEVEKSYIELRGGTYGYVYGGGNNATVTTSVDICLDNATTAANLYEIDADALEAMGVSTDKTFTKPTQSTVKPIYQFDRVFGGNNKAEMKIQPKWHLLNATINNLYSGGNEGDMTYEEGLLLVLDQPNIEVNTVYGGCRRANVEPKRGGQAVTTHELPGYLFPEGFSARVYITAGKINNVYGGNDISGNVVGGNALDIRSSIIGDVYGGGNGSYAYTDNPNLAGHDYYRDFYYDKTGFSSSAEALNAFRPNAQQAWIHVSGTENKPTLIGGSLYCGGNSATLSITENDQTKKAELNIGSYVIVDNVYLGSNGTNMIDDAMLALYHSGKVDNKDFSSIDMTSDFEEYIEGVSLGIRPKVSFETNNYVNNSTQIGSFFLGGNLGSITASGTFDVEFEKPIIIYDKLVAGCNDANYKSSEHSNNYGIDYKGGIKNNAGIDNDGVKIRLNVSNVTLLPKKVVRDNNGEPIFDAQGKPQLVWNKTDQSEGSIRLKGANIYGGCYTSGHINGGVEINLNGPAMRDDIIFDDPSTQAIENSGIIKEVQQQDVLGRAMSVFGGGMGEKTEIWGHTTVNITQDGYILQAFGGGEKGVVGKYENGSYTQYNATVNLNGGTVDEIYGGGFEGFVSGNTTVNVLSGKAVDVFGGACNADVGGLATVYVGGNASGASNQPVPDVQNVFGGNDYSGRIGTISGLANKTGYNNETIQTNTYVEYLQGQVDSIFGGSYGSYEYPNGVNPPFIVNSFINFKPNNKPDNKVKLVFGGGWGDPDIAKNNEMQQRSYVLVNAPNGIENFTRTDIFGSGAYSGLGMNLSPADAAASPSLVTARVDLVSGKVHDVYGASYKSGFTRRTEVNVPNGSTINVYNIFGGGYGVSLDTICDTYEATINYNSAQALVRRFRVKIDGADVDSIGSIYGGNNNSRRTFYSFINIESPVYGNTSGYTAPVYGAGYGENTWTQYTEINLKNGANVYEAYGGGEGGMVLNKESVNALISDRSVPHGIGSGYDESDATYDHGGLNNALVHTNRLGIKTNTNVNIWKGAQIGGYCYGAGLGETALVSGTTYVGVYGGIVWKDLYAAGTSGAVNRLYSTLTFTPETYAYLEGGSVRNIYGGGWKGDVGSTTDNVQGNSHIIIGTLPENFVANETGYNEPSIGFYKGMPTVQRNAYAGGEGGAVYGMANLTMNNGRIGYEYTNGQYVEKIEDDTHKDDEGNLIPNTNLKDSGNIFGGGYKEASDVDNTNILMMGGIVRNSLYGGGEIATVGHGTKSNTTVTIQKAGKTHVEMYSGQVLHDVFGGGKGYDNLGRVGENLHTDGYVFGSTEVYIYGGKVGSPEGVSEGYGNVFGGGNVGYVYSGTGTKSNTDGYYYNNGLLTEDCRVIVSPYAKVLCDEDLPLSILNTSGQVVENHTFHKNEYVPTEYLNSLQKSWIDDDKRAQNKKLDWVSGVNIYNAVFAGGNVSSGSNVLYANTKTVFGNATATLNDVYHCDLITVGTEHVGGLYGDGNLTFVDGYRELNITNYGTDYYGQSDVITLAEYNNMNDRERAYFELKYKCQQECWDDNNTHYSAGSSLAEDDLRKNFKNGTHDVVILQDGSIDSNYWIESGFCSIYAGRLLNTIQRADFVGVFGSRMVMQGAQDRVPSVVDYTEYTINRVGEVSLNQNHSRAGDVGDQESFGNYFGIYNIVNHLGALTSDVDFYSDVRFTKNNDDNYAPDADVQNQTYADWKIRHVDDRKRNNGSSVNKVALAAGVYLELTTENSTPENKDWGIATGVMELDLINVMPGLGGGFVYAKNVHGVRSNTDAVQVTLSKYNEGANSMKRYQYTTDDAHAQQIQTSGNFIHSQKQIFDDCYPQSNSYTGNEPAPAHYWFIKGQIYLYNQYISAYTGAADAYSKTINIPLTVTAGSHGTLKLQNVQPNKYAYYSAYIDKNNNTKLAGDAHMVINNLTYHLNDTISYWEWSMLSESDQKKFVDTTYVTIADCKIGETTYAKGTVLLPSEFNSLMTQAEQKTIEGVSVKAVYHMDKEDYVPFTDVFRLSNNISHDNGYILTFDMTNPEDWDTYYSPKLRADGDKISTAEYKVTQDQSLYMKAPTYTPGTSRIYGQRHYNEGELITQSVKDTYDTTVGEHGLSTDQQNAAATFKQAYVLSKKVTLQNNDGTETYLNAGYVLSVDEFNQYHISSGDGGVANYCTNTFELKKEGLEDKLIYQGMCLTRAQIEDLVKDYICQENATDTQIRDEADQLIHDSFTNAYICTHEGMYGGGWYDQANNYSGLKAWSALTSEDRENFSFNYDALDLLIDPKFTGNTKYYDAADADPATQIYSDEKPLDYNALYKGSDNLVYVSSAGALTTIRPGDNISRVQYEDIPNERYHYAPFEITEPNETIYVVKEAFVRGDVPYSVGNKISEEVYRNLGEDLKLKIDKITGPVDKYYYCRQSYVVESHVDRGTPVTADLTNGSITEGTRVRAGDRVNTGFIINDGQYGTLINKQTNFNIYGKTPVVTSTFYVSGQSNIQDLSKGKVMTVIYQYNYEESDETGNNIEPITERHIINIYIQFKSGTPTIGQLGEPSIVLPGSSIGLTTPIVKPGAYEVIGGGWELFPTKEQAEKHVNGVEFDNVDTKLYWYQNNGYHVAYYAKTYLGKTYSNPVRVRVANYHDLDMVMRDSLHHMYIDNPNVERNSKIYIDGRDCTSDRFKSKLDLLKDLFDLSLLPIELDANGQPKKQASGELKGHVPLDENVKALANLEFILRSNVSPKKYSDWTPIGKNTSYGFQGTLHGDGYTISGLNNSLLNNLCDSIYNLGVTGSFTGSGIADLGGDNTHVGYAENCWINTSGTITGNTQAIIGTGGKTVNCYYPDNLSYTAIAGTKAMPLTSFYNGEVTYNLNGFYLTKRYADNNGVNTNPYKYYQISSNSTNTLNATPSVGHYNFKAGDAQYCYKDKEHLGYVESRYIDGDFVYASGTIPTSANERRYTATLPNGNPDPENGQFFPIWPDDYIFFGQMLTYGHVNLSGREYQQFPTRINKADRSASGESNNATQWLVPEDLEEFSNRVYRAPAYFGNSTPAMVHYNAYAVIPAKTSDNTTNIYPGLTAVDFTAKSDLGNNGTPIWYEGWSGNVFNKKVLDHTKLVGFNSEGQTRNLLVYDDSEDDADILRPYFNEPAYGETDATNRTVAKVISVVKGHLVMKKASGNSYFYQADGDQFLVDNQDFNAPISYSFGTASQNDYYHMWYQRTPQNYVMSSNGGWETISLPFTAELVTTHQKGEITHFYTGSKVGHEYWLREFNTVTQEDKAEFSSLDADANGGGKTVRNTFLWTHYYSKNNQKDARNDTYQTYYDQARVYGDYPLYTAGVPYLIGFPGETYYEFDLSGDFAASHTATPAPGDLDPQVITFVSGDATVIRVTDLEYAQSIKTDNVTGYSFVPTYQAQTAGDAQTDVFVLAGNGTKMVRNSTATTVPFRAYLTGPVKSNQAPSRMETRGDVLYISYTGDSDSMEETVTDRGLYVYNDHMNICVESSLEYPATVTVTNVAGKVLKQFTIQPGTKVTVPVNNRGVYLVNRHKIAVTK